jgi:hypothetical protein
MLNPNGTMDGLPSGLHTSGLHTSRLWLAENPAAVKVEIWSAGGATASASVPPPRGCSGIDPCPHQGIPIPRFPGINRLTS